MRFFLKVRFHSSINEIPEPHWNAQWETDYPFTRHQFLAALENSGCTTLGNGWRPHHGTVWHDQQLVAAIPLYIKAHSYGEYVFDWSWADAYHQHGIPYYPKLVNAVPFTPCCGPRWGTNGVSGTGETGSAVRQAIDNALTAESKRMDCSSTHILFPSSELLVYVEPAEKWSKRHDIQYHWINYNYQNFDEYLHSLTSRKRKNIRKEREKVLSQDLQLEKVEGTQLTDQDWVTFHNLYRQTYLKRSGHQGYLNEPFFRTIGKTMADQIFMVKAIYRQNCVAASLFFFDSTTLYGRYWGSLGEFDSLHFECCYYQGIEYAIEKQLRRFDPGAQGEHKISRGFQPVLTASLHYIHHDVFAEAVRRFADEEKRHVIQQCQHLRQHLPFKDDVKYVPESYLIQ